MAGELGEYMFSMAIVLQDGRMAMMVDSRNAKKNADVFITKNG